MSEPINPWRVLSKETAFANPWISLERCRVIQPSGAAGDYTVVRFVKVAVGALPIEADGTVHLVGQWRFPLDLYSWEMPEGGAEPGESPEAAVRRELEEEAGLVAGSLREIQRMHLSNSVTDELAVLYLATELSPGRVAPDETEVFAHRRLPFTEALDLVVSGAITDAMTVAAMLRAHHMAVTGGLEPALARAMLAR